MTVTDRLREAIEKYGTPLADNRVVLNLDDVPRIAYRAGLDAVQPLPTDAEIEAAIREYVHSAADAEVSAQMRSWDGYEYHGEEAAKARANLLRLIAQQQPKKVFLAVRPDYEGLSIYGVFLTEGEAEQRVRELGVEDHRVYDYEVGVPL